MVKRQPSSSSQVLKCDVGQGLRFAILGSGGTRTSPGVRIDVSVTKAEPGSVTLHGSTFLEEISSLSHSIVDTPYRIVCIVDT